MILSGIDGVASSINQVSALESDLVPFLKKDPRPSYRLDAESAAVIEAKTELTSLLEANTQPA